MIHIQHFRATLLEADEPHPSKMVIVKWRDHLWTVSNKKWREKK